METEEANIEDRNLKVISSCGLTEFGSHIHFLRHDVWMPGNGLVLT
jgi:hypothetical protein